MTRETSEERSRTLKERFRALERKYGEIMDYHESQARESTKRYDMLIKMRDNYDSFMDLSDTQFRINSLPVHTPLLMFDMWGSRIISRGKGKGLPVPENEYYLEKSIEERSMTREQYHACRRAAGMIYIERKSA